MLILMTILCLSWQNQPVPAPEGVKVAPERILIQTKAGYIAVALYPEVAPKNVEQVMRLVSEGVYDGVCIPRIERNFVMQFSGAENDKIPPLTHEQRSLIQSLPGEFSKLKHVRGVVSMARDDGQPNSARTSFSILLNAAPHLDGLYTIIGHVEYGMDVVEELIKAPTNGSIPRERLTVTRMHLVDGQELHDRPPPPARVIFTGPVSTDIGNVPGSQPMNVSQLSPSQERAILFSTGILLMIVCVLAPMLIPGLKHKQAQTIQLISVLIGGFLLVAALQPLSMDLFQSPNTMNLGHVIAILLFFGLLGVFRLMSSFESAS